MKGYGKKSLDVGCGSGARLIALRLLGYDVFGLDIQPSYIDGLKRAGFNVLIGDVEREIPFNESFDLITCFEVLEHLKNPIKALENMIESLNPSGFLVVTTPNRLTEFFRCIYLFLKRQKRTKGIFYDETHISVKSPIEWRKIVTAIPKAKLLKITNFIMPWFNRRNFLIHLPYIGSSTLIVISRDHAEDSQ